MAADVRRFYLAIYSEIFHKIAAKNMGLMVRNGKRRKMAGCHGGLSWRVGGPGERAIQAELSQTRAQSRPDKALSR